MSNDMEEIIMQSCDLPTMPDIAGKVVQLVSDPNTTADILNKAIMADPAMAARVLKLANSSFYGCLRSVNTLTQAIVIIGFGTIKNIPTLKVTHPSKFTNGEIPAGGIFFKPEKNNLLIT